VSLRIFAKLAGKLAASIRRLKYFEVREPQSLGQGCDSWYLIKDTQLTIIEERMPAGTAETLHKTNKSRQFFFVLAGSATMEHGGAVTTLVTGTGLEIPLGVPHRILNQSDTVLEFLVTSQPPSHADRVELTWSPEGSARS